MTDTRQQLLEVARAHVGKTYEPTEFEGFSEGMHWCGAFALQCLHETGLALDLKWKVGLGFLYKLPRVLSPKPGDMVYFQFKQHHAILVDVDRESQTVHTIDGNQVGGQVLERTRPLSQVAAFYSIENLIHTVSEIG